MTIEDLLKVLSENETIGISEDCEELFYGKVKEFSLPIKHFSVKQITSAIDTNDREVLLIFVTSD